MLKSAIIFLILLSSFLWLTCDGDFPIDPTKDLGHIMVTHASPDFANVDVYVGDTLVSEDLSYPNSTSYTALQADTVNVSVKPTGTDDIALQTDIDLKAGDYFSVFACDAAANLTTLVIKDEYPQPGANETLIRFVHLAPDAPAVDVTLSDGTKLFESIEFKGSTAFKALPAGPYDLQIRLAGTDNVVVELKDFVLAPNVAHTFWARGFVNGAPGQELGGQIIYNRIIF